MLYGGLLDKLWCVTDRRLPERRSAHTEINFDFGTRDGGSPAAAPQLALSVGGTANHHARLWQAGKRNAAGWFDPTPLAPEHAKT